jgi:chitosanase
MQRTIPCSDCADKTLDTRQLGFRVTGCNPDPTRPGFCLLSFEEQDAPQAEAAAAAPMRARATALRGEVAAAVGDAITATQAATAKAIVNLFETGEVLGLYGSVTVLDGDSGHLSFGRSQASLGSGNLALLLQQYCANHGARFADRLAPFLRRLVAHDESLDNDQTVKNLLRASADDPVMRDTQDAFFDAKYWQPALRAAHELGLRSSLAAAVVYDSFIQGSWTPLRDQTLESAGTPAVKGEAGWISAYVATRRQWLASSDREVLRSTVYRMDALQRLIDQGFWGLALPLAVRGKEISTLTLAAMPPGCFDGPQPGSRPLGLQMPMAQGLDVRQVQLGLSNRKLDVLADGLFGQTSFGVVKAWQLQQGRPATGILDAAQISELTS